MGGETKKGEGGRRSERKEEREAGDGESNKISSDLSSAKPLCSILFPLFCGWLCSFLTSFNITSFKFFVYWKINNKWVYKIFKTYCYAFVKMQTHKFERFQSTVHESCTCLCKQNTKSILNKITARKLRRSPGACH